MIIIPGILESFRSLVDGSFKVNFGSQELTPEQVGSLSLIRGKYGYMAFKETPFKDKEKEVIDQLEPDYNDTGKTPSQRLRGVFYRIWEQDKGGYEDFNRYYDFQMNKIIEHFKTKLD